MARQFEIVVEQSGLIITAELLEDQAPLTCDLFWESIAEPWRELGSGERHGHPSGLADAELPDP